jgi:hypothetical protein
MEEVVAAKRDWIPLGEFARRLGIARASVYGRIKRGTLEAKRGNRGGYLVQWPPPAHEGSGDVVSDVALQGNSQSRDNSATVVGDVVGLQAELAQLRERLAVLEHERQKMAELRMALSRAEAKVEAVTALAKGEVEAVKRVAAAEVEAMRTQVATQIASRNIVIEELKAGLDHERARSERLEGLLTETRRPWWRRWLAS